MKKTCNSLKRKLATRWSFVSGTLLEWVTQWDNVLHSELERFWLELHWYTRSYCGNQRYYKASRGLRVILEIVLWLTSSKWGYLFVSDPKLALVQPNGWWKKFEQTLHFVFFFIIIAVFDKQANIHFSINSISRSISSHNHNSTNQVIAMGRYQSSLRKLDNFFSGKQQAAVKTDQKFILLSSYLFLYIF